MTYDKATTITIPKSAVISRKFNFFFLMIANFVYLFLLYIISQNPVQDNQTVGDASSVQLVFEIALLGVVLGLILNQRLFIPKANKIEEPFNRIGIHMIVIILGIDAPGLYGLTIGFISLQATNSVNWLFVSVLVIWSFIYGIYFYLVHFQPTLNDIEIGKEIPRNRR